ncbi:MAG: aldolase [Candidatus Pristimantibacillus sp.]
MSEINASSIANKKLYSAFGLRISSDIELPELLFMGEHSHNETVDAVIELADLTDIINEFEPGKYYYYKDDYVLIVLPDTASYRIVNGQRIQVMPVAGVDARDYRIYLLGVCAAILLFQRRTVPLHGSSVIIDGKAYAIVGDCGAGKSTLAAAFLREGYKLLSDDIVAVTIDEKTGTPIAHPGFPQQKLWQQSLNYFSMESDQYKQVMVDMDKYSIPVMEQFHKESLPLAGIFELDKADIVSVSIKPLTHLERIQLFQYHTYSVELLSNMGLEQWHFSFAANTAFVVPFYQLRRPAIGFSAPSLVNEILHTVSKGEVVSR